MTIYPNQAAGGLKSNRSLTKFGHELLEEMKNLHMILDLAHLNEPSTKAALKVWEGPLMVSHTALSEVFHHPQNLTCSMIKKIIDRDGIVGFAFLDRFYGSKEVSMTNVLDHLCRFKLRFGSQHCALGTDYYGFGSNNYISGLEDVSKLPLMRDELRRRGWKSSDIDNLLWKNAERFLKRGIRCDFP